MKHVLITGGAGFIGSHLTDQLLREGVRVRVLDSLDPQVHGASAGVPPYFNREAELQQGDICDRAAIDRALQGVDAVVHLAAAVGVGQSMYEIARFVRANSQGTANLLQAVLERSSRVEKLVVASSMSIYGEGAYSCNTHGPVTVTERSFERVELQHWEPECPECSEPLRPQPTAENKKLHPTSVYALTKKDQEDLVLMFGRTYGIPVVALRYFNVYGSRQAVSNPYTGVAAIFAARLLNGHPPLVFEDGGQLRDFVHVSDVARANLLALKNPGADHHAVNIGAGTSISVNQIAAELGKLLGREEIQPKITRTFRKGDIRHCFGDITQAKQLLGYQPQCSFSVGMQETVSWLREQNAQDRVDESLRELKERGLTT